MEAMKRLPLFIFILLNLFYGFSESGNEYYQKKLTEILNPGRDFFSENVISYDEECILIKARQELEKLSLEEQVSLLFILQVDGRESLPDFSKKRLQEIKPGGVLLFGYNISENPVNLISFMEEIKNASGSENPVNAPLVFLDHEGGYVNRLRNITWPLPSAHDVYNNLSPLNQFKLYSLQAIMLKIIGIDINLAPVAEPGCEFNIDFLDTRASGNTIHDATAYTKIFVNAMESQGLGTVLKHFPGNTNEDPHKEIPVMNITKDSFAEMLKPFSNAIGLNPAGVLLSFVKIPEIDDKISALSQVTVSEILIDGLGFKNLVISDDLTMAAVKQSGYTESEAVIQALNSGCKMIMMSSGNFNEVRNAVIEALNEGRISRESFEKACLSVLEAKLKYGKASDSLPSLAVKQLDVSEKLQLLFKTSFLSFCTFNFGKWNYGKSCFIF